MLTYDLGLSSFLISIMLMNGQLFQLNKIIAI